MTSNLLLSQTQFCLNENDLSLALSFVSIFLKFIRNTLGALYVVCVHMIAMNSSQNSDAEDNIPCHWNAPVP